MAWFVLPEAKESMRKCTWQLPLVSSGLKPRVSGTSVTELIRLPSSRSSMPTVLRWRSSAAASVYHVLAETA